MSTRKQTQLRNNARGECAKADDNNGQSTEQQVNTQRTYYYCQPAQTIPGTPLRLARKDQQHLGKQRVRPEGLLACDYLLLLLLHLTLATFLAAAAEEQRCLRLGRAGGRVVAEAQKETSALGHPSLSESQQLHPTARHGQSLRSDAASSQ